MSQTNNPPDSSLAHLIADWQQIIPTAGAIGRMQHASQSVSATLAEIDSGSLFDTEPALLQTILDVLTNESKNDSGTDL
jgi:hypothetical protein